MEGEIDTKGGRGEIGRDQGGGEIITVPVTGGRGRGRRRGSSDLVLKPLGRGLVNLLRLSDCELRYERKNILLPMTLQPVQNNIRYTLTQVCKVIFYVVSFNFQDVMYEKVNMIKQARSNHYTCEPKPILDKY